MKKNVGLVLVLTSTLCLLWIASIVFNATYWIQPPAEKFVTAWTEDIHLLEKSQKLPKQWAEIKEIVVKADNSPVQDWLPTAKPPIKTNPNGRYRLEAFFIHWIDGNRYGVVVQYNLVDLVTTNTIWEIGRTYKLGLYY